MKFKELREKKLTPAEKKKREEIAKAIEKDDPDMPMDKKMAIATATAKKVAEGFTPKEVKMAIGIASDKRYAGGNMTGAVNQIEKIKKGLSKHKQVAAVLKRQNEDLEEARRPSPPKIKGGNPKGSGSIKSIRGSDGRVYDVDIAVNGRKIEFKVKSDMGDFKTISLGQAARLFK